MNRRFWSRLLLPASGIWLVLSGVVIGLPSSNWGQEDGEDSFYYDPVSKRDPFLSPFSFAAEETTVEGAKTPLQRFELGQLKLVGVIWEANEPRALIEDSAGLGYIVTMGTLVGSNGGIVKSIEPKRIVVEEYDTDFYGQRHAHERELLLVVADTTPEDTEDRMP